MVQQKALDLLVGKGGGHSITGQNPADLLLRVAVQPGQTGVFGVHFLIAHSDVLARELFRLWQEFFAITTLYSLGSLSNKNKRTGKTGY